MTLKKAERLIPAPASQPAMRFIGLDLENLDTYPPEGQCLFFLLKPGLGLWDRFYGERRGFTVFPDLYGLTFRLDQIKAWAPAGFTAAELRDREKRKLRG